ncbi:CFA46 protein, partial [Hemiprocne comata]|nr:CFA46 protein [Hemiprocne comata]
KEILEQYHDPFTLHWEGVTGNIRVPSQAEWEQLLTNCSAFLFYGMEGFMSHVLPNRLVAMNIPRCHLMMLLDLVRSKQSYQRITNSSIHKSCLHAAIERPTETAMLLSLTGVRSVVANQWFSSVQENAERLEVVSQRKLGYSSWFASTLFQMCY